MEFFIDDVPYLKKCEEALFLFQAFDVKAIDFSDLKENVAAGKIKIKLELSSKKELQTTIQKSKLKQRLCQIYRDFYQEIEKYGESSCYLLMNKNDYLDWFEEEVKFEDICKEIELEVFNKFGRAQLTYLANDLTSLIGTARSKQVKLRAIEALEKLQKEKSDYEFLEKAPMDIGLMICVAAGILGIQVFLWNRIGIALNTYYYAKQYSSFFWTFGITILIFSLIILLLFIPLFFSLRSGLKDLIKWSKIIRAKK